MTSTELLCVLKQWISWHAGNLTEELLKPSSSTLLYGVSGQSQTPLLETNLFLKSQQLLSQSGNSAHITFLSGS